MRIIYVPQYPTPMRYAEWWFWKLPEEFRKAGHEVIVLGEKYSEMIESRRGALDMFSPINMAIELETEQIREYMMLDLKKDDVLFWSDLSFPGAFGTALFHKRPSKMFVFCHATSINRGDYYAKYKDEKFIIETAFAMSFDKVFVGSKYHQDKLGWRNTVVTYLPFPPINPQEKIKSYDIMSASRPNPQKVDLKLEEEVESEFSKIHRPTSNTWEEYFDNLAKSKILLITSHEDTFGYQIIDAILNGCIPIARNGLAYTEILPREYLYNDKYELVSRISYILESGIKVPVPEILCQDEMDNFYNRIINEMEMK
jgi:hypothetical protein